MSGCLIGASCTRSMKQKIICVFAIWLFISICLLCIRYYYNLTLSSFFCISIPDWFNYNHIRSYFIFLLYWRTVEFPKFMLIFLVAVLISWFRWCRVFFILITFRMLNCSPLVICSFLTKTSASIFTIFMSVLSLTILCSSLVVVIIIFFTFLFRFSFFRVVTEFSGSVIKIPFPFRVKYVD